MESTYTTLLEKTRVPQASLQKFAVISIFSKLRTAATHSGPESDPGRDAISRCIHSPSPAVVNQSVRELCRLVSDSKLDVSIGLLELLSALEETQPKFVNLFVKGLGFLIRIGFERKHASFWFDSTRNHPFVKILLCRSDVQFELVNQVLLFMAENRMRMVEVCEFLKPFMNFCVLRISLSDSLSTLFARQLVSSMASICCSYPREAIPVFKLLMGCFKYLPCKNLDEVRNSYYFLECVVDAYIMVLRHLVQTGSGLVGEAQWLGFELSETIFSLSTCLHGSGGSEPFIGLVRHLLVVQKDLALKYRHEFSPKLLSLLFILVYSDLDHEQISVLKLLLFIFKWKSENEHEVDPTKFTLIDELLFTFPVISLMSSTSRLVKEAAADLLLILEKLLVQLLTVPTTEALEKRLPSVSTPGTITYRLLQDLWLQRASFFIELESVGETDVEGADGQLTNWASRLKVLTSSIVDRRKSSLTISQSQEMFLTEMLPLVGAIASVLVMHQSLGNSAVDLLAAIGNMDPKQGVPLLLAVLFYNNIFTKKDSNHQNMLPKLLAIIPSLASHNGMMPLVIQTILPMLQKDGKPLLYATGTRLLCQTWEKNDRAFDSLQAVLLPEKFTEYRAERNICISLAACIRDVCRINPDRGVDLILSVSACINSQDPVIQSIGLQGLSHLCEADVIDFYTAWDVIAKHLLDYTESPALALSLCLLLRWGSLDAEAYSEASTSVLDILWKIGSSTHFDHIPGWPKARASAFEALVHYELPSMERGIPDFKRKNTDLLLCETNEDVLKAMKEFQVKIIKHEHENRRRFVKEKKVAGTKIEKLLDVIPQVLFPSGKKSNAGRLPAAALLCLSFTPNDFKSQVLPRCPIDVHTAYECAMVEIAASVELSRNLVLALLSLQSWKSFMQRWMRANISSLDEKATSTALDKTSKAANDIMKSVIQFAEKSVPRSAENIALAIGALCLVLPQSAHTIKSTASNFLLNWLSQYEHECRQWSAAVSLGLISCCLHITDHKQKFENINGILEVLRDSKNSLVKGACGVGLGFSCQDLLTGVEAANKFESDKENYKVQELALLGKIVKALLLNTSQLSQASYEILDILPAWFALIEGDVAANSTSALFLKTQDNSEDDIWGTAGLVLGLGSSIGALYRAGAVDVVVKVKDMIISWMPHVDSAVVKSGFSGEESEKALSVGSTLVLPTIVAFCWRVEIMREDELDHLVKSYSKLISELLLVKRSDSFFRSLMMASCIGAGNLLACISSGDVRIVEVEYIKGFLEMFRKCYLSPYPPIIRLGGMLGVVNAMGAGAGILVDGRNFLASITTNQEHKELSNIPSPLLSSTACETQFTTLIQEMFLIAQNLDDIQMQQNAAWAVSFLRTIFWSYGSLDLVSNNQKRVAGSGTAPLSFHEDSSVMKLTSWLLNLDYSGEGTARHINTIVTIFRCLSQAPRLPAVDWSSIVRRCMRYKDRASDVLHGNATLKTGILRLECLQFSIAQSNQSSHLLTFVDEISNLSRFRTLELNLQLSLLSHLPGLVKVFSGSRLEKLFNDIVEFFLSDSSYQSYSPEQKSMLRISCWEGLNQCLEESSLGLLPDVEKCMETMFCLLHTSESESDSRLDLFRQEWSKMVKCLGKAREDWLLDFLQVPLMNLTEKDDRQVVKKILTKAKLVKIGSVRFAELGKVKTNILNCRSHGIWNVLIEVVAAIQRADSSIKRQWLVDAVEISCVSSYPSTAMRFIGLLSGSFCKYMPLLTMDQTSVLSDLPVTLTSLLKESDWEDVAESVASNLLISTERLYYCVTLNLDDNNRLNTQPIDESEKDVVDLLLQVMHETCVHLIDYLPLEKRIQIANIRC